MTRGQSAASAQDEGIPILELGPRLDPLPLGPITGLDLPSSGRIRSAIREERQRGVTVVLTTHELADAAAADWVLLLAGRVVAAGPPDKVLTGQHLEQAYGVTFRTEGGRLLDDDAVHRSRMGRQRQDHVRTGSGRASNPQ